MKIIFALVLLSLIAIPTVSAIPIADKTGLKFSFPATVDGDYFVVEGTANFDVKHMNYDADKREINFKIQSSLDYNLVEIIIPNNLLKGDDLTFMITSIPTSITLAAESSSITSPVIPKIIHQNSKRKHGPYIAVNCGAIPEGTIDSELFGHEKGSFTGAIETRKGYFEFANKGTVFLDEIAELPMSTQARLLRILESGEYFKVGSSICQKSDIRIIAATNKNIEHLIKEGKFRSDLYYRLNSININVPPLRKRKEDIKTLFLKFGHELGYKLNKLNL